MNAITQAPPTVQYGTDMGRLSRLYANYFTGKLTYQQLQDALARTRLEVAQNASQTKPKNRPS